MWYCVFCLSVSSISDSSVLSSMKESFSLLRLSNTQLFTCLLNSYILHFTEWHIGWFHFIAVVTNTTVNIGGHTIIQHANFTTFGYTPRSGMAGSYGESIFSFVRVSVVFHKNCINYTSIDKAVFIPCDSNTCGLCPDLGI